MDREHIESGNAGLSIRHWSSPPIVQGYFDLGAGCYLSSALLGDVDDITQADADRGQCVRVQQVHSMKILRIFLKEGEGYEIDLIGAEWDGERYLRRPVENLGSLGQADFPAGTETLSLGQADVPLSAEARAQIRKVEADGILCNDPRLSIGVSVADCMPIFAEKRQGDAVRGGAPQWRAVLHSGWAGTGILRSILEYGLEPALGQVLGLEGKGSEWRSDSDVQGSGAKHLPKEQIPEHAEEYRITLGPCISAGAYRVSAERAEIFAQRFGERAVSGSASEGYGLDLRKANISIVESIISKYGSAEQGRAGRRNVDFDIRCWDDCTYAHSHMHSYREQGHFYRQWSDSKYSRMLAFYPALGVESKL